MATSEGHQPDVHPCGDAMAAVEQLRREIAELKRDNASLRQSLDAAESASRAKGTFLAHIGHEIRPPVTAVLGYADRLLESGQQTADERAQCLQTIRRNGRHVLAMVNDILDLSQIEAGKIVVEPSPCSPTRLVAEVVATMEGRAADKELTLQAEYRWPLPAAIQTDPIRLRQILLNLIGNAVKFTETGGVRVVLRRAEPNEAPQGHGLTIEVIDTGIGVAPEQLGRLFEPFVGEASAIRRPGGMGLGLAISRRLAQILGGDIRVHSLPGQGSTFTLTLDTGPVERWLNSAEPLSETSPATSASAASAGSILVAEDGPDNQELILFYLQEAGFEAVLAENGRLAVDRATEAWSRGKPFDLILMDMQMPEMDGYEATAKLRAQGYRGRIMALTANATAGDREKCMRAGCDEFADKPIERRRFLDKVREQLRVAHKQPAAPAAACEADPERLAPREEILPSRLAGDPRLAPLLASFVSRLPVRIAAMERALAARDIEALNTLVHQFKGAASGYGFPALSEAARGLEHRARTIGDIEALRRDVAELSELCERARRGIAAPDSASPAPPRASQV